MATISTSEWHGIVNRVRQNYPNLIRQWFDQLSGAQLQHGVLEVLCCNGPQQRYLGRYCTRPFCEAAQQETGRLVSVRFALPAPSDNGSPRRDAGPEPGLFNDGSDLIALNSEYRFEQFVTAPCNRLAHAACVAVSAAPGDAYNPLFIHGDAGLGKTHLLQAVCQHAKEKTPNLQILYLSCETFNNHFIEAVERGALHQFRFRYRHVDILVIDDIQFLAGRERTQEELFHTFNTLHQARKQIVLSADCSPREIPKLENRLISRFNWGLVARIDPPGLETRMAIIRKKARLRQIDLQQDVIYFIAQTINTNARELEGAITTLDAHAQQLGQVIDLATAHVALGSEPGTLGARPASIAEIVDIVAPHFGVKKADLVGGRRTKSITLPRQVCMQLARELTPHTMEEIGRHFGGRDHTTVVHACRRIAQLRVQDPTLSGVIEDLKSRIRNAAGVPTR